MLSIFKKLLKLVTHAQVMSVFLAFALMVFFSYNFMSGIERRNLMNRVNDAIKATQEKINSELLESETTLNVVSETVRSMILNGSSYDQIEKFIMNTTSFMLEDARLMSYTTGIYAFFDVFNEKFCDGIGWIPPDDYNPKSRPWYTAGVESAGSIGVTQPFIDIYSNSISVTFVRRIFDNDGNPLGIVCMDILLDRIRKYAIDTSVTEDSYGILLDKDFYVIAHPHPAYIGKHISLMNDGVTIQNELMQGKDISERKATDYNGNPAVLFIRRLDNGWYLAILAYSQKYYKSVVEIAYILIVLALIFAAGLSAILLSIVMAKKKAEEQTQVLLDSVPLCANLWDSKLKLIDCNQEAASLFQLSGKKEYIDKFFELSPEYQPDGKPSVEKAHEYIRKTFDEGYQRLEWLHRRLDGELIPCEITLVRVKYRKKYNVCGYSRDLRDVKSMIAKMRETDECAQVLFDTTPLSCFMIDNSFKILECNQEIVRLFELSHKNEFIENINKFFPEYQPSGELSIEKIYKYINMAFEEGCCNFEWICQNVSGEQIPAEVSFVRVKFRGVYAVAGYIRDLRELRTMMEKMKEAEERTMMMVDATPLGITMWDENINLLDFNYEAARVVGIYNKQEFRERFAQTVPEYQPDGRKSAEKLVEIISAAFKDGKAQTDWSHNNINGEAILFEATAVRLKYKDRHVAVIYCRDMREINNAIAKMREADECTQVLFDATPLSCFMIDNTNRILECNQEIVKLLGLSGKKEYIDRFFDFFPEYQPSGEPSREKIIKYIYEAFGEGYCNFEWIHQRLDGEQIPTEVSLVRVKFRGVYAVAGYIRDLRELNAMIAEMRRAEIAEESNKAKSDFLAKMSHEIRTPLNAILGITEIQLQNGSLPLALREGLERIYNSGDLLLGIINDILDLSKIEAGKLELINAQCDISSLIHDIVKLNVIRYESKPIDFKLDVSGDIPTFLIGDELRIKQILNNLLSNAFKYTDEGLIELSLFTELLDDNSGVMLVFRVSDTGQGMTPEQIKKLGDKFSRFNLEANRKTEGAGLGMNITLNLIRLMNGNITVESTPGMGSVFAVKLPQECADRSPIGKELADNLKKLNLKNVARIRKLQIKQEYMPYGRVLVVDDVESNLFVARGLLVPYGLSIDIATSGFEAIDKIRDGAQYDIIFMDHMMPRMDGIEAVKIIRSLGYKGYIVALTANAITGQAEIFLSSGFDDFISKPIDIRQLNAVLNKLIRDKQSEEVLDEARRQKNTLYASGRHHLAIDPQLAEYFVRDGEKAYIILENIFKNNLSDPDDLLKYIINIHAMKSALANIGEGELSDEALELEQAGRDQNIDLILTGLPEFLVSLRNVIDKLKPPDEITEEIKIDSEDDIAFLQEKLLAIQTACVSFDKKAAKEILAEVKVKTWPRAIRDKLSAISERLLHSEFEEAAAIAREAYLP